MLSTYVFQLSIHFSDNGVGLEVKGRSEGLSISLEFTGCSTMDILPGELLTELMLKLDFPSALTFLRINRQFHAILSPALDRLLPAFIPQHFVTTELPFWARRNPYSLRNILRCRRITHVKAWIGLMWKGTSNAFFWHPNEPRYLFFSSKSFLYNYL